MLMALGWSRITGTVDDNASTFTDPERGISVGSRSVHEGLKSKPELILKALELGLSTTIC